MASMVQRVRSLIGLLWVAFCSQVPALALAAPNADLRDGSDVPVVNPDAEAHDIGGGARVLIAPESALTNPEALDAPKEVDAEGEVQPLVFTLEGGRVDVVSADASATSPV